MHKLNLGWRQSSESGFGSSLSLAPLRGRRMVAEKRSQCLPTAHVRARVNWILFNSPFILQSNGNSATERIFAN